MSFAINHSFARPATPAGADGHPGIPTADARGAGRGTVGPHTNPQSAGAVTISHPQSNSSPIAVYCPGGLPLPDRSTRALSSTAGERSELPLTWFAIWPSPLPCRAAGGEGIRDGLINTIPTLENRLPDHSGAPV